MKEIYFYLAQQVATPPPSSDSVKQSPSSPFGDQFGLIMMVLVFVVMYFLLIFPQRKEEKKRKAMLAALQKGDSVVTSSGIIGNVVSIKENTVLLNVGDNTRIEFLRSAITSVREEKSVSGSK